MFANDHGSLKKTEPDLEVSDFEEGRNDSRKKKQKMVVAGMDDERLDI